MSLNTLDEYNRRFCDPPYTPAIVFIFENIWAYGRSFVVPPVHLIVKKVGYVDE